MEKSGGTGFQPVQKTSIYQRVKHRLEACATQKQPGAAVPHFSYWGRQLSAQKLET
jgi:hypothetical protein